MLAFRVVCWSHQSDLRIRVCIRLLHKNNWITHQSDCRIRVCISHQSYQIIWISCTNHSVWGLYTKNDISWAHLINVMVCGLHEGLVAFNFLYHFNVRAFFFQLFYSQHTRQTTYIPSRTMKTTSKVQSEHIQSLHYMNSRQFFTCFNGIPAIKFHFATLDFAPLRVISL